MPTTFSKPVPSAAVEPKQSGRKRTLNPKLTSEDNVHADAVKRRKLEQAKSGSQVNTMQPAKKKKTTSKTNTPSRRTSPSVEDDLEDIYEPRNSGHSNNTDKNLEVADGTADVTDDTNLEDNPVIVLDDEEEEEEGDDLQEETDEHELGTVKIQS
jgi:hypothetical protein